jgi:menaquinone-dependent protoporphyrinogen oxidase
MNILIAYATIEGQTRKICRFCADTFMDMGYSVELLQVCGDDDLDPARYDAAILAASVHLGHYQKEMVHFATAQAAALSGKPSLFLSVSLAVCGDDPKELADLDRIAGDFARDTGFAPGRIEQVAGAFRFGEYDFFKSWAMRYIAARKGQAVDLHGDTEYTDWDALRAALTDWLPT